MEDYIVHAEHKCSIHDRCGHRLVRNYHPGFYSWSYEKLREKILNLFELPPSAPIKLQYSDGHSNDFSICNDEELHDAHVRRDFNPLGVKVVYNCPSLLVRVVHNDYYHLLSPPQGQLEFCFEELHDRVRKLLGLHDLSHSAAAFVFVFKDPKVPKLQMIVANDAALKYALEKESPTHLEVKIKALEVDNYENNIFHSSDLRAHTIASHGSWFGHGNQEAPPKSQHQQPGAGRGGHIQQLRTGGGYLEEPHSNGELVTIFCEQNRNYRLTSRIDGFTRIVVLAYKDQQDPTQYWTKIEYGDKFSDEEGQRGFVLVNKATCMALSHSIDSGAVTQEPYHANGVDNSVLWSAGKDLGKGWHAIRKVTNIHLNLDADHGDEKHGGVQEGNRLCVCTWNNQENQKWMIQPSVLRIKRKVIYNFSFESLVLPSSVS